MAVEVVNNMFGIGQIGVMKEYWLVGTKDDQEVVEGLARGGAFVNLSNGTSITNWTSSKGVGDFGMALEQSGIKTSVIVAFPAALREAKKVQNYLDELKIQVSIAGGNLIILDIPKGSLKQAFNDHSVEYVMESFGPDYEESSDEETETVFEASHADFLYKIAERDFHFCHTDNHEYFLLPKINGLPNIAYMVGEADIRNYLSRKFREETGGNVVGQGAMISVMSTLEGECAGSKYEMGLEYRSGNNGDTYWMDLGTPDGKVVKYNAEGWEVLERMPNDQGFAFRRSNATKRLPVPENISAVDTKDTLNKLIRPFVSVSDKDWPLVVGWMVKHMMSTTDTPIMLLVSEAQSGKSTATRVMKYSVEGVMDRGSEIPEKADDIAVTMSSERITMYNNISSINLKLSNLLCQIVESSTYKKRKLRTDNDEVELTLNSSVIMNGITTGALKGDFKTRTVRLELDSSIKAGMTHNQIDRALKDAHPQVLGALLSIAVEVVKNEFYIDVPGGDDGFRMVEYAKVLKVIDDLWGLDGSSWDAYKASLDSMSEEAMEEPLLKTIRSMVLERKNRVSGEDNVWEAELGVNDIIETHNETGWGDAFKAAAGQSRTYLKDGNDLRGKFTVSKTDWKRMGITLEALGSRRYSGGRQSYYKIRFSGERWAEVEFAY